MDVILLPLLKVVDIAIHLFIWALIISAALSWLVAFGVVNTHNRLVYSVMDALYRVTEPALRPIRRLLPNTGGLDLSPLALILLLYLVQEVLYQVVAKLVY